MICIKFTKGQTFAIHIFFDTAQLFLPLALCLRRITKSLGRNIITVPYPWHIHIKCSSSKKHLCIPGSKTIGKLYVYLRTYPANKIIAQYSIITIDKFTDPKFHRSMVDKTTPAHNKQAKSLYKRQQSETCTHTTDSTPYIYMQCIASHISTVQIYYRKFIHPLKSFDHGNRTSTPPSYNL